MKFKSIFLISLLLLSTTGVVFAAAGIEWTWPRDSYDKTIEGNSTDYQNIWDFGSLTICYDDDGSDDPPDNCAITNDDTSWIDYSDTNTIDCKRVNGVDKSDHGYDYDSKLQCRSANPSSFTAGSEDVSTTISITLIANDGGNDVKGSGSKTFTITLTAPAAVEVEEVDNPPIGDTDSITVYTNDPVYNGTLTGYDIDNEYNALDQGSKFYIVSGPDRGTVTLNEDNGEYTYTTTYTGTISTTDEFDFKVCDGPVNREDITDCSTAAAKISIDINYVDVPPVWDETKDYTITLEEDQGEITIPLRTDNYCLDLEPLSYRKEGIDTIAYTNIGFGSSLEITPFHNMNGEQTVTVICSDSVFSEARDFIIDISPSNDAPIFNFQAGDSSTIIVSSSDSGGTHFNHHMIDPDGDEIHIDSYRNHENPSFGNIDMENLKYIPSVVVGALDEDVEDAFEIKVCDSSNACSYERIYVTITGSNRAPEARSSYASTVDEDGFKKIDFSEFRSSDPDGHTISEIAIKFLGEESYGNLYLDENYLYEVDTYDSLSDSISPEESFWFKPKENISGQVYTFEFDVMSIDGIRSNSYYEFSISILAKPDAPKLTVTYDVELDEDKGRVIPLSAYDADNDLDIIEAEVDNLALFSEITIDRYNKLHLEPIEDQFGTATITVTAIDELGYEDSYEFDVTVNPRNDRPTADDASFETFRSTALAITSAGFTYNDIDSEDLSIKILSLPKSGTLAYAGTGVSKDSIYSLSDLNLDYSPIRGAMGEDSFEFLILDDEGATTERYTATIDVLESQFGPNSQPSRFGGSPILLTGWSCKAGYVMNPSITIETVFEAGTNACIPRPNIPPIANFTISVEQAQVGDLIFFLGTKSSDPDGIITDYTWKLGSEIVKTGKSANHIYTNMSDCTAGVCTIELTVTDNKGDNATTTSTLILTEQEIESPDYSDLTIIQGNNYTNEELTYLGLKKGDITRIGDKDITVDTTGKVTRVQQVTQESTDDSSQSEEPDLSEYGGSQPGLTLYTPYNGICEEGEKSSSTPLDCIKNDGYCAEALGEHSGNSDDCGEGGSWTGMFVLLAFLTLLGGGAFYAWKKGLLGSHNVSIGAKPTTTSTMPARPAEPAGPGQYIKTQRAKGFSNEQIRGALKNKGWDDDKIDEALNASRE